MKCKRQNIEAGALVKQLNLVPYRLSQVHLTIRAQLLDLRENNVLATREFYVTEVADSDDPYGGVMAANRAVKKILQQITEFSSSESKNSKAKQ